MIFIRFIVFLSTLFLTTFAFAKDDAELFRHEKLKWGAQKVDLWWRLDDGWVVVEEYRSDREGFPRRQWRRAYQDQQVALRVFHEQLSKWQSIGAQLRGDHEEVLGQIKGQSIWPTTQAWSLDWEKKYSDWIETDVDKDFFVKYAIATDCADVSLSLRWIFARMHGLPVLNHVADGNLMNNETIQAAWASLPTHANWWEDQKFRAALDYFLDHAFTHSLFQDSYPVAISSQTFSAGVFHLHLGSSSGHTQVVHRTDFSSGEKIPFLVIMSTVPRQVRTMVESLLLSGSEPTGERGGFLRHLWVVKSAAGYKHVKREQMWDFSLEQYAPEFLGSADNYLMAVFKHLNPQLDLKAVFVRILSDAKEYIKLRLPIVEQGYQYCKEHDCSPGTQAYEDWSTPTRDKNILMHFDRVRLFYKFVEDDDAAAELFSEFLYTPIIEQEKIKFNLEQIETIWYAGLYSSEPWDTIEGRWALLPEAAVAGWKSKYTRKLDERRKLVKKAAAVCVNQPSCKPGSLTYEDLRTVRLDQDLRLMLRIFLSDDNSYCSAFPNELCQRLVALMHSQTLVFDEQEISIQKMMEVVVWLQSDPRLSEQKRWYGQKGAYEWQIIDPQIEKLRVNSNKWAYLQSAHKGEVKNFSSGEVLQPSPGYHWQNLSDSVAVAVARNGDGVEIYHFATSSRERLTLPGLVNLHLWQDRLTLYSKARLQVYSVNSANPGTELIFDRELGSDVVMHQMQSFVLGKSHESFWILEVKSLRSVSLSAEVTQENLKYDWEISVALSANDRTYFSLFSAEANWDIKSWYVDFSSGKSVLQRKAIFFVNEDYVISENYDSAEVFARRFDSNLQIIEEQRWNSSFAVYGNGLYLHDLELAFDLTAWPIQPVAKLSDESEILSFNSKLVTTMIKNHGGSRIRPRNGGNSIFTVKGGALFLEFSPFDPDGVLTCYSSMGYSAVYDLDKLGTEPLLEFAYLDTYEDMQASSGHIYQADSGVRLWVGD